MAILDKESRSRGLRMPSLSAIKSRKKIAESPTRRDSSSEEVAIPARMDSGPGRSLHSQEKDLPPNPLPSPPPFPSAPTDSFSNQSPYHHINPTPKYEDRPLPRFPRVPVPKREEPPAPAPVQQVTPPSSEDQYPIHHQEHVRPIEDPLESFIPEPEPELDDTSATVEPVSVEESNGPWTPPDYEPVAAPLNQLHYACYQDHRSMPIANNLWHPLPCMTCQKYDREIRYRCVFCCLRICAGCYQALQKCPNRSLEQLMKTMPSHD
ncbi:hypothetical protein BDV38DRAFT_237985 [Aspergillus pseudotamarii]|uniref:Uncharacterized protein n=1 Tax=Aspergillus pseudotamarii TaxID=132259 RepID=A0A5N6T5J8_ASPPS|nr:uncharacterized protein BDV38DRAFT_237985 [Aspergillus pseudotamarii]KAE8141461.1 hypothetical protein BDV38DRAFT_237985 [Aspergillus pseudotamarii]